MNRKSRVRLNVRKVLADFRKAEESSAQRNGTFKIAAPFEEALDAILKAKPRSIPQKSRANKPAS